jgi:hypothetical protein
LRVLLERVCLLLEERSHGTKMLEVHLRAESSHTKEGRTHDIHLKGLIA